MTAVTTPPAARRTSFLHGMRVVGYRAVRSIPKEPETAIPAIIVPVFFFVVNIGALQNVAEFADPGFVYKAFHLRASLLVTDIQDGYFDRLLMTPVHRRALLLGLMIADFVLVVALSIPVLLLGFAVGVRFETGVLGLVVFTLMGALWGLVFTGFPYSIALKTGNPGAVNSSFILFFPFAFLTTSFLLQEALTGWLSTIATWNPVTYLLAGMRARVSEGWDGEAIGKAFLAILGVGVLTQTLAFRALKGRVARG